MSDKDYFVFTAWALAGGFWVATVILWLLSAAMLRRPFVKNGEAIFCMILAILLTVWAFISSMSLR